jgi:hypothetical protein
MHCAHRLKELHGSLALGVGAGVGFGVGFGVGAGVGCGVGSGVGVGVGSGVGLGVGAGVGLGVGAGVGLGVGLGVGFGVGLGVGAGVGGVGDATSVNVSATLSSKIVTLEPKTRKRLVLLSRLFAATLMLTQVASKSLSERP